MNLGIYTSSVPDQPTLYIILIVNNTSQNMNIMPLLCVCMSAYAGMHVYNITAYYQIKLLFEKKSLAKYL